MIQQTTTHVSLLARLSAGDDALAWREFCDRYGELILNFGLSRGLQRADADEVMQEVLLALTRNMPGFTYDPAKGRFRAYLKTVALRAIIRKFRQKAKPGANDRSDAALESAQADPEIEQRWDDEWRQYHLRLAMRTIRAEFGETDLAAFDRYVGEGRDASATASELGLSVDQVYQAKSRILKRLRELIAQQTAEEG